MRAGVGQMTEEPVTFDLAEVYRKIGVAFHRAKAGSIPPESDANDPAPYLIVEHSSPERASQQGKIGYDDLIGATGSGPYPPAPPSTPWKPANPCAKASAKRPSSAQDLEPAPATAPPSNILQISITFSTRPARATRRAWSGSTTNGNSVISPCAARISHRAAYSSFDAFRSSSGIVSPNRGGLLRRTPAPPPFSGMNSTPAASRAAPIFATASSETLAPPCVSKRFTVGRDSPAALASSVCDHPMRPRAARI